MTEVFIDSNILIYAASGLPEDSVKTQHARRLLKESSFHLSVQVLNEFTAIATSPRKLGFTRSEARLYNNQWMTDHTIHPLDTATHDLAMRWYLPQQLSLWDSLIIASANLANCTTIFSEDMNHGQTFGNVTIINPFREE